MAQRINPEQDFGGTRGVASRTRSPVSMGTLRRRRAGADLPPRSRAARCPWFIPGKGNGVNPPRTESTGPLRQGPE